MLEKKARDIYSQQLSRKQLEALCVEVLLCVVRRLCPDELQYARHCGRIRAPAGVDGRG
jgi:hypothetical protein